VVREHYGRLVFVMKSHRLQSHPHQQAAFLLRSLFVMVAIVCSLYGIARTEEGSIHYQVVNGKIEEPLTNQSGDLERGLRVVLDREKGDCVVCHALPLPERQFHGTVGPPLDGVGKRYAAGELRLRLVDPKVLNPQTVMPAYYKTKNLYQVLERYRGKPILTAQEIEDTVAYLLTLK